jgi:hypothetical protein
VDLSTLLGLAALLVFVFSLWAWARLNRAVSRRGARYPATHRLLRVPSAIWDAFSDRDPDGDSSLGLAIAIVLLITFYAVLLPIVLVLAVATLIVESIHPTADLARQPVNTWMVMYRCRDGTEVPGSDYYATEQEARLAASKVETVIASRTRRAVRDYDVLSTNSGPWMIIYDCQDGSHVRALIATRPKSWQRAWRRGPRARSCREPSARSEAIA